jgi:hypothetical protein
MADRTPIHHALLRPVQHNIHLTILLSANELMDNLLDYKAAPMLGVLLHVQEGVQGGGGTSTFSYSSAQKDVEQNVYVCLPLFPLLQFE